MKLQRQTAIIHLITDNEIKTQEELSDLLKEAGFPATQATISRDIKELRLIKVTSHDGSAHYASPDKNSAKSYFTRLKNVFKESVIKIDQAQNLVVLKTITGMANAAAAAMDAMDIDKVVGTIAGDDTILIILRNNADAAEFCDIAGEMLK